MAGSIHKVNIGELKVGRGDDVLAAYGVGSCVIVVCYDVDQKMAAMLHGILPEKHGGGHSDRDNKYLDAGIDNLVREMIKEGASIHNMHAKIFGGAKMFDTASGAEPIGDRNIKKAKEALAGKGIPVAAEDTGKNYGRTVEFSVATKIAVIKSFSAGTKTI